MNRRDLLFTTARFNLSEVQPHFINSCCFGEDLLAWIRTELGSHGVKTTPPVQEDWGWYSEGSIGKQSYFIGVGGNAEEGAENPNRGEWRVILQKGRSFVERLRGKNDLESDDKMLALLMHVLGTQPDFENRKVE